MAPCDVDEQLVALAWLALSSGNAPMRPGPRQTATLKRVVAAVLTEDRRRQRADHRRNAEPMAQARRNRARQRRCAAAYEAGQTLREIAAGEGICVRTVRHYLDAAGVAMRPRGRKAQRS
jgi:DNA-binding NarL/FixJ family response regulator